MQCPVQISTLAATPDAVPMPTSTVLVEAARLDEDPAAARAKCEAP